VRGLVPRLRSVALAASAALVVSACGTGVDGSWRRLPIGSDPKLDVFAIAIDPARTETVYVGTRFGGMLKTLMGGSSWTSMGAAVPLLPAEVIMRLGADVTSIAVSTDATGRLLAGTAFGGVLRSDDAGASWRQANAGLVGAGGSDLALIIGVLAVVTDPSAPSAAYASLQGRGVFRTDDWGRHWTPLGAPERADVRDLVIEPGDAGRLFAATLESGVYESGDGGRSWRSVSSGVAGRAVHAIAIDLARKGVVYAGTDDGVVRIDVDGPRPRVVPLGLRARPVRALVADPCRPGTIFAGAADGVHVTTDGGRRWRPLNRGLTRRLVLSLALASGPAPRLFVATQGGGLFALDLPRQPRCNSSASPG
jgi:hypothetical protein